MNTDQLTSIIRTLLKFLAAFLVAHGYSKTASFIGGEEIIGYLVAGISMLWSHLVHLSDPTALPVTPAKSSSNQTPLLLLIPFLIFAVMFTGCKTTPQRVAYQAAGATQVTVDTAMTLWGAYVAADHPGTNAEYKVESAYEKYQAGFAVLADAGKVYASTGGTNSTATAALSAATLNVATEISDVETLITSFGVTLK